MNWKDKINIDKLPKHVAIIMDGNGRWAQKKGKPRVFGHKNGVQSVREVSEAAAEIGVSYLTLYAFSTENWGRPKLEVNALMHLLIETVNNEMKTLNENNIKLNAIGEIEALPKKTYQALLRGIEDTKNNTRMTLNLALNYSGRWDIEQATKTIAQKVSTNEIQIADINQKLISDHLSTANIPDPELLIRTSGEFRISNYLLWQIAYTELHFTDVLWPEFRKEHFYEALVNFQSRDRRFGKINKPS